MPNDDEEVTPSSNTETDDTPPLEVKIINKEKITPYDSVDNEGYDDLGISEDDIKDFEENK